MDTVLSYLIAFIVAFTLILLYIYLAPDSKISTGVGSIAGAAGEAAGAAAGVYVDVLGGVGKMGKGLLDKCPTGFKKFMGSKCRIDRPTTGSAYKSSKSKNKNKNSCTSGGYQCKYNGSGKGYSRYADCSDVHPWTVSSDGGKKCTINANNIELQQAKKDGISVNQLMVNKGYPALPGYGDYEESFLY